MSRSKISLNEVLKAGLNRSCPVSLISFSARVFHLEFFNMDFLQICQYFVEFLFMFFHIEDGAVEAMATGQSCRLAWGCEPSGATCCAWRWSTPNRHPLRGAEKTKRRTHNKWCDLHTLLGWRHLEAIAPSRVGWRPSLLGWMPLLVGWRQSLVGWRQSLVGWRASRVVGGHR